MGLTAHFYKTKSIRSYKSGQGKEIAYFRNNWQLHNELGNGLVLLDEEKLDLLERFAREYEDFNKDYGDGESAISGIEKARKALAKGFLVYYEGSH